MDELLEVHEVSKLTGITIRTLQYYDNIGLLTPSCYTEAGYRMYDEDNLMRLQDIMLFKELEFSLKEIKTILDNPHFDRQKALEEQIKLLELKREHLDGLIEFALRLKTKEELSKVFDAFDKGKMEAYQKLAKAAWGETAAYKEYEEKSAKWSDVEKRRNAEDMMDLFYEFGDMKSLEPGDPTVQDQVKKLQSFITKNYYTCTDEILAGLGQMYVAGGDMTKNINVAGGKGCAEFVSKAIEIYCSKNDK